jgi:hypothetical protein
LILKVLWSPHVAETILISLTFLKLVGFIAVSLIIFQSYLIIFYRDFFSADTATRNIARAIIISRNASTPSVGHKVALTFRNPGKLVRYIPFHISYPTPKINTPGNNPAMKTRKIPY